MGFRNIMADEEGNTMDIVSECPDFMTIEEVADYLSVSSATARKVLQENNIEPQHDTDRNLRDLPKSRGLERNLFSRTEINKRILNGYDGEGNPNLLSLRDYAKKRGVTYFAAYFSLINRNPDALCGLVKVGGQYMVIEDQVILTAESLAKRVGLSARTIRGKASSGDIPVGRKVDGAWEFPPNTAILYDVGELAPLLRAELKQLNIGVIRPEDNEVRSSTGLSRALGIGRVARGTHIISKDEGMLRKMHADHGIIPMLIKNPATNRPQDEFDTPFPGIVLDWEDIITGGQGLALQTADTYPGLQTDGLAS